MADDAVLAFDRDAIVQGMIARRIDPAGDAHDGWPEDEQRAFQSEMLASTSTYGAVIAIGRKRVATMGNESPTQAGALTAPDQATRLSPRCLTV